MLVHLKRVGRRYAALTWAIVLAFAFSPAVCMANAVGAGVFTRFLIHAHDKDEEGHVHHAHFDHGHDHHGFGVHHQDHGADEQGTPSQHRLHVHFDVCCPSVLIPELPSAPLHLGLSSRVSILPVHPTQEAPPDRLLRPPIL